MKVVIKFICLAALAALLLPGEARAQTVYYSTREILADFFKTSETVTYKKVALGPAERARLKVRLGYQPAKGTYTFYVASTGDRVDGYALIDDENGEHLPITFAVKLSPSGAVERQEIVAYREPRGDEVRDDRFRHQFVGKTVRDPVSANQDIVAISGATISSRAMAVGVRRALVLFDELLAPRPANTAQASTPARAL